MHKENRNNLGSITSTRILARNTKARLTNNMYNLETGLEPYRGGE